MDRDELTARRVANDTAAVAELTAPAPEVDRIEPGPASTPPRWIRPLADYERKETTIVEGLRYG